jgi:urease gamma subunit
MAFLFGVKKTEAPVPKVSDSIQALREACSMVEKRQQFLSEKMEGLVAAAKARLQSNDRKGAAFQLQRKKMLEKERDASYGKLQNLEVLINSLEAVATTTSIVQAMKAGQQALAETIKLNDVDKIEDIMDDINESIQQVDEVSEAMGRPIGAVIDEVRAFFAEFSRFCSTI